jgi:hypothetical protein
LEADVAYSIDLDSERRIISLEDYISAIAGLDLKQEAVALETAPLLKRLANNKQLLLDYVNTYLQKNLSLEDENPYGTQSFIIYRCDEFFIRLNIWIKPKDYGGGLNWETRVFSYETPHNHNFDFLTANCLGDGYRTEIYDYDPSKHLGYLGEKVDLQLLESTRLSENKVIYFRKFKDVHIQYAPDDELSVSLNLMISDPVANRMPQFEFDVVNRKIINVINNGYTGPKAFFGLVKHLGDTSSIEMLQKIGDQHVDPRVRAFAWDAALGIEMDEAILERLLDSNDAIMRAELLRLRGPSS